MQMCHVDVDKRFSAAGALDTPWILKSDAVGRVPSLQSEAILDRMRKFKNTNCLRKAGAHLVTHSLADNELEAMRQTFMAMDKNGDGTLSLEEVKAAMAGKVNLSEMEALFKQADTDGSGQLEYTEFLSALASTTQLSCKQACAEAFRVLDKDGNGSISLAELKDALGEEGHQVEADLRSVDKDGDGKIDFDEFLEIMQSGASVASGATPGRRASVTSMKSPAAIGTIGQGKCSGVSAGLRFMTEKT